MRLSSEGILDPAFSEKGYLMPAFDVKAMRARSVAHPKWAHLGAGNIFRAFPAVLCQKLLDEGAWDTGISVVECYDEEIIGDAFAPYDDLCVAVSLKSDGTAQKRVVASVAEALGYLADTARVREIFCAQSLQMVTMTITEKGYAVTDASGAPFPFCAGDFLSMDAPVSIIGKLAALLYLRYRENAAPLAMVSMDNCSRNGAVLKNAILKITSAWREKGLVGDGFIDYLSDDQRVSFPWTMIDKITPRPDESVLSLLQADGLSGIGVTVTGKNTFVSAMVNAEESEYLAIEDSFPAGRPPLERAGVLFGDRTAVERIENMKVCTCLNPLHTALAIFGCLLRYDRISEEMRDPALAGLARQLGYTEGLPVAAETRLMSARAFLDEVIEKRLPNPFMPDTPQRIACDTSKKLPVRFGETLKKYVKSGRSDLSFLTFIPLVFAGYARYLTGVADDGLPFTPSPDPNLNMLRGRLEGYRLAQSFDTDRLHALFSDASVFGVDLYKVNLGKKAERIFAELNRGPGSIRRYLEHCVQSAK